MVNYEYLNSIKFFVLYDNNAIDGFATYEEAKEFCTCMNNRYNQKLVIFAVDSVDDEDKELERIRESYICCLQEQEEEWNREDEDEWDR